MKMEAEGCNVREDGSDGASRNRQRVEKTRLQILRRWQKRDDGVETGNWDEEGRRRLGREMIM